MLNVKPDIINHVWQQLQSAQNILLHCHYHPDPDSAGSALALMHALQDLEKNVVVIQGDTEFPASLKVLPGADRITRKNFSQINLLDFDTFIVVDSSNTEQITRTVPVVFPPHLKIVVIDHHQNNQIPSDLKIVDENIIATSEIIFKLFKIWSVKLTPEISGCLFMGIFDDSGGFKYQKTTADTYKAAAELVSIYPDFARTIFNYQNNLHPKSLLYLSNALNSLQHYFSDRLAVTLVENSVISSQGISRAEVEPVELSNLLKSVTGWDIGVAITEYSAHHFDFSLRSRIPDELDVSAIARALGGGGHKVAAGATVTAASPEEVLQKLLTVISETYPQLGAPVK